MTGVLTWLSQETLLDRALVPPTENDHLRSEFWRAGYSSEPYKTAEQIKMFFGANACEPKDRSTHRRHLVNTMDQSVQLVAAVTVATC